LASGALSSNVSELANALSTFAQGVSTPISTTIPQSLSGSTSTAQIGLLSASTVKSLTALSSFNANGQAITASVLSSNQVSAGVDSSSLLNTQQTTLAIPTTKKPA
jgi:hypothetical protein